MQHESIHFIYPLCTEERADHQLRKDKYETMVKNPRTSAGPISLMLDYFNK